MPDANKSDQSKTERQEGEKGQPDKPEPQPERPLKHLYEVFTKDTAESNKFLANYEKRLAEHLEQIEHQPVDAKATRNGNGTITFDIACNGDESVLLKSNRYPCHHGFQLQHHRSGGKG